MGVSSPSSPSPDAAADSPRPTYTKMITKALTELGGTSCRAGIAGFIVGRFTGLPATHDALLSAHLHRLILEGVVRKFSSTYIFPAPSQPHNDSFIGVATNNSSDHNLNPYRGLHASNYGDDSSDDDDEDDYTGDDDDDEYTPARAAYMLRMKRGRRLSNAAPAVGMLDSSTTKRRRGRPRKEQEETSRSIKRGPGRPRKDTSLFPASTSATKPKKLLDLNLHPYQVLRTRSDGDEDVYSGDGDDVDDDDDDDDDVDYTPLLGAKHGRGHPGKRGRDWPRMVMLSSNGGGASSPLTKRVHRRSSKIHHVGPSEASFQNGGDTSLKKTPGGDFSMPKRGRGRPTKDTE